MGHLSPETLARLVSEAPTSAEGEHLARCPRCSEELRALREQTEALGALPALRPPEGDWPDLEARLVEEGLIQKGRRRGKRDPRSLPGWLQAVAALVLFLGGAAVGDLVGLPSPGKDGAVPGREGTAVPTGLPAGQVTDLQEAAELVQVTERQYIDALVRFRQLLEARGETPSMADPAGRFAALEGIVAASRAAVRQAPAGPFINGVLASALAEREVVLRTAAASGSGRWF